MRTIHAAMLAGCLCCALMPAFAKDAGWQWYNEKLKPRDEERKAAPAAPPPQMDILEKLATLQAATKRSLYEAILYPSSENFVKYFRLQNYWTQQAGLFSMSAKKAMLENPGTRLQPAAQLLQRHGKKPARCRLCRTATGYLHPRTALRRDVLLPGPGSDRWPAGPGD